jgi:hypothetical protein
MSPPLPDGGLHGPPTMWTEVFNYAQYDNDPIVALSYSGGAIASHAGYLYWGSINFPMTGTLAALLAHEQGWIDLDRNDNDTLDLDELAITFLGTQRPISIFRGSNMGTVFQKVELVYGSPFWPSYDPVEKSYAILPLKDHRNNLAPDHKPLYGLPGFGNFFNAYTWTMKDHHRGLYIGTFDWSYMTTEFLDLLDDLLKLLFPTTDIQSGSVADLIRLPLFHPGADLYRLENIEHDLKAQTVFKTGGGNYTNYGVRTMVSGDHLYLGMANAMNLLTDPHDNVPEGGWELLDLDTLLY